MLYKATLSYHIKMTYGSVMLLYDKNSTYGNVTISNKRYHMTMICYIVMLPYDINTYYITLVCYIVNLPYHRIMTYGNFYINI